MSGSRPRRKPNCPRRFSFREPRQGCPTGFLLTAVEAVSVNHAKVVPISKATQTSMARTLDKSALFCVFAVHKISPLIILQTRKSVYNLCIHYTPTPDFLSMGNYLFFRFFYRFLNFSTLLFPFGIIYQKHAKIFLKKKTQCKSTVFS